MQQAGDETFIGFGARTVLMLRNVAAPVADLEAMVPNRLDVERVVGGIIVRSKGVRREDQRLNGIDAEISDSFDRAGNRPAQTEEGGINHLEEFGRHAGV